MTSTRLALASILLPALAACGGDATADDALTSRVDSAGVSIVTNIQPSWRAGDAWQIAPEPVVQIGPREDGDPHYEFLRLNSGVLLPGGELALLNASSQEIRFYSADGTWLRSAGQSGDGPGELRSPSGMQRGGDTLFVLDGNQARVSAFSTAGAFLATWPYPTGPGRVRLSHRLEDGTWIGTGAVRLGGNSMPTSGTIRNPSAYLRVSLEPARTIDSVVVTTGSEVNLAVVSGAGTAFREVSMRPPPFARSAPLTVGGGRVYWGDNAMPELRVLRRDGTLEMIVRWAARRIPVTADLIGQVRDANMALWEGDSVRQQFIRNQYEVASPASEVPYFSGIHVDHDGNIWLREYPLLPTDSTRFEVFQADGQQLGTIALGPRHTILDVGTAHLLTMWLDDDELEHARVYRILR